MIRAYCEIFVEQVYVYNNGDASGQSTADKKIAASLEYASPDAPKITNIIDKLTITSKESLTLPALFPFQNRILKAVIWNDAHLTLTVTDSDQRNQALLLLREVLGGAINNLIPSGINFFTDSLYNVVGGDIVDGIEKGKDEKTKTQIIGTTPKLYLQLGANGLKVFRKGTDGQISELSNDEQGKFPVDLFSLSDLKGNEGANIPAKKVKDSNGLLTLRIECNPLPLE